MWTRREAIALSLAACFGRSAASAGAPSAQFSDGQYAAGRIEKILGRNFARLFSDVWSA